MYVNVNQKLLQLPSEYKEELLGSIREEFINSGKTIVVLDDDPTGTQTSYDVTVLTSWRVELITEELKKKPSILFILTNTRSLPEKQAVELTREIGRNLKQAIKVSGREIIVICRGDSTLRGHFPAETDAIAPELDMKNAVIVLVPAFIEGGRFTIDDIHYIVENQELVPVSDTAFAKDVVFGYRQADL
ncbi:MAG: four-carbon acid sugar kinase family protein, partial [Chitinophagaceae bacterium]